MSIKKRFLIYFLIIFIVFGAIATYSIWHSFYVNNSLNEKIPESINIIQKASKQNTVAQLVRYDDEVLTESARNYAFTGEVKWKNQYYQFIPKLDLRIKEAIELGDQVDIDIFNSINNANLALMQIEEKAIKYVDNKDFKKAQNILSSSEYLNQKEIYKNGVDEYLLRRGIQIDSADPISTQFLKDTKDYLSVNFKIGIYSILMLVSVFLLTIIFLFWFIVKTFMIPLNVFKKTARKIINGNLKAKVEIESNDEIGDFAVDFNKMTESMSDLYKNLDDKVQEKTKEVMDQKSAILNILEDVEKEKDKAENLSNDLEKFKLAVDNASDQVVITDPEGIVVYGNKAIQKITGFTPQEALGKKAGVLWKIPMPNSYYEKLWDTIKNKKEVFTDEIQNKRKNDELYFANISISPVLNDQNDILYFVAIE
ncbi:MAG: PAS domain-containing protein, partial [bacterium]